MKLECVFKDCLSFANFNVGSWVPSDLPIPSTSSAKVALKLKYVRNELKISLLEKCITYFVDNDGIKDRLCNSESAIREERR